MTAQHQNQPNATARSHHTFGGAWTLEKLTLIDQYIAAWAKVMSNQRFERVYLDAFAGSGHIRLNSGARAAGSALRAIQNGSFDKYFFFEQNQRRADQLQAAINQIPGKHPYLLATGDFNDFWPTVAQAFSGSMNVRAVAFLDPYGMSLRWETLASMANTQTMDIWYLFPLSGLFRQATRSAHDLTDDKQTAITRILGTTAWRDEFYEPPQQTTLFDPPVDERHAEWPEMLQFVTRRLRTIFPTVPDPRVLRSGSQAPLYALYFCGSNPSPKAQGAALRIARHIIEHIT